MDLFTFYKFATVIKDWLGKPSGREALPVIKKPSEFKFVLHDHKSERQAGHHKDIRLLDPKLNVTFNWAVKEMPKPGEVRQAFATGHHPAGYLNFEGRLTGYGQGTVKIDRSEKAEVLDSSPERIKFNLYSGRTPEQYMIKATGKEGWIIRNITPSRDSKLWSGLVPSGRPKYKEKKTDTVDLSNDKEVAQAKVDGANSILVLREGKQPRVFSSRPSKSSLTGLLEHSFKIKDLMTSRSPKGIGDTVLRAELFGVKGNKATPARILGGILNANTPKSREMQQEAGISLKLMPFDVVKYKGQDASAMSFRDKLDIIHRLQKKLPYLQLPITAESTKDKAKLLRRIQLGREPLTREGIILRDIETDKMTKVKIKPRFSVHIRNIFAEAGNRKGLAGGFDYSLKPKGEIVGRVGTGFDLNTKKDMLANPEKYIGRVAKIEAQEAFPSGALRAPAFKNLHLDR